MYNIIIVVLITLLLYSKTTATTSATVTATKTAASSKLSALPESQRLSIRLCCGTSELFNTTSYRCEGLPQSFNLTSWNVSNFWSDGNMSQVNILLDLNYEVQRLSCRKPLVFKFFEYSNDTEHCYTPYYHTQLDKYIIATVDCAYLILVYNFIYDTYPVGIGFSSLFLILTIVVYAVLKDLRHTLHWKMFLSHFVSWLCSHILIMLSVALLSVDMVLYALLFFLTTRVWLNVIGFEIWLHFMNTYGERDINDLGRWRFSIYSLYVWGVTIAAGLTSWFVKGKKPFDNWPSMIPIMVLLLMAIVGFCYLTFELFRLRHKIVNTTTRNHFVKKSLPTILCTIYMMILPWIMFLLWLIYLKNIYMAIIFYIYLIAEGPTVFAIFAPKRKIILLWKKATSGRREHSQIPNVTEQIRMFETTI